MKHILIVAALLSAPALAQQPRENSMLRMFRHCADFLTESKENFFAQGRCAGGIEGLVIGSPSICPAPGGWTLAQAVRIVVLYAEQVPEQWSKSYLNIAFDGLTRVWPCEDKPAVRTPAPAVRQRVY